MCTLFNPNDKHHTITVYSTDHAFALSDGTIFISFELFKVVNIKCF